MAENTPHELVAAPHITPAEQGVFADAWNMFTSTPSLAQLASLGGPTFTTTPLQQNARGLYAPGSNTVAIDPTNKNSGQVLNTLIHEFVHRAQNQPGARTPPTVSLQSQASAAQNNIAYGPGEEAAWLVANMIYAPPSRAFDDNALQFIDKNREEAARIFREGVNPHLPVQKHYKGDAEMNIVERALTAITGTPPIVQTKVPPWTEEAITRMKVRNGR